MLHQILGRGHDRGDAGLVVRAEQRQPRRRDDVVAELRAQRRMSRWPAAPPTDRRAGRCRGRRRRGGRSVARPSPDISGDVSTCAMKPMTGTSTPATSPESSPSGSRCSSSDDVVQADARAARAASMLQQHELAGRARTGRRRLVGARVDRDVAEEAIEHGHRFPCAASCRSAARTRCDERVDRAAWRLTTRTARAPPSARATTRGDRARPPC